MVVFIIAGSADIIVVALVAVMVRVVAAPLPVAGVVILVVCCFLALVYITS